MATAIDAAAKAEREFPRAFAAFAPDSWSRYNASEMTLREWCRAEARRFHHEVSPTTPFLRTYYALATYANTQQGLAEQRAAAVAAEDFGEQPPATFATPGQQTAAEVNLARAELNRILFREHTRWWDAFQEEENGRHGWVYHAAKVLARRADIPREDACLVVEAWMKTQEARLT